LFDPDRVEHMTTNQLISIFKMLHNQANDILEFLDYVSQQPIDPSTFKPPQDDVTSKLANLSPESRNKLRTVLAMLVEDEKSKEGEDVSPPSDSDG
jgi:DNA-directed RNA polymerase subunit F